jgi:hypothetical protein
MPLAKKAILEMYPMQQGDVKVAYADTTEKRNFLLSLDEEKFQKKDFFK